MNNSKSSFLIQFTITLLMLLLCLSCPVKSEIKLSLNIPISEKFNKIPPSYVCSTAISSSEQQMHQSLKSQKYFLKTEFNYFSSYQNQLPLVKKSLTFTEEKTVSPIPIYILNEQYRI